MSGFRLPEFFRSSAIHGRGFPRAERAVPRGITPPPGANASEEEIRAAFQSNRETLRNPEVLEVFLEKKGSQWPDFIGFQSVGSGLLASAKVVDTLTREGVTGFSAVPVHFASPLPPKLDPAPSYFALKPTHEIPLLLKVFERSADRLRPLGSYRLPEDRDQVPKDGSSICKLIQPVGLDGSQGVLFGKIPEGFGCDRRVAELAFRERWTNLQFRAFGSPYTPGDPDMASISLKASADVFTSRWYSGRQEEVLEYELPPERHGRFWERFFGPRRRP